MISGKEYDIQLTGLGSNKRNTGTRVQEEKQKSKTLAVKTPVYRTNLLKFFFDKKASVAAGTDIYACMKFTVRYHANSILECISN